MSETDDQWTSGTCTADVPDPSDPDDPGGNPGGAPCVQAGPVCLLETTWYMIAGACMSVLVAGGFVYSGPSFAYSP